MYCPKCKKEIPPLCEAPDARIIREIVSADFDCEGNPVYDMSKFRPTRNSATTCYWCGTKLVKEESEPEPEKKPEPKAEPKPAPEPKPKPEPKTEPKPEKKSSGCFVKLLLLVAVVAGCFYLFKDCGGDDENSADTTEEYFETDVVTEESDVSDGDDMSDADLSESFGSETEYDAGPLPDYSSDWDKIEKRLAALGTPLDYVQKNSSVKGEKIKEKADKEYKSIKDEANNLYEKIKDAANDRYEKKKKAAEKEYDKVKDDAYAKYENDEYDYSKYDAIRSAAYQKYDKIRSEEYSRYDKLRSEAYQKYDKIRSDAYSWYSKVSSISYNVD